MNYKLLLLILGIVLMTACEGPSKPPVQNNNIVCTEDARECPDGSWVGRSGPHCEFICPK